ncbi:MAG: 23S rRNA (pseudouridine(1915)-N(3))-methyltransferase RlmH [Candidatus Zixiibacteriota bacterium]
MVKINLIVVGKNKYDWLNQGIKHYQKLLKKYQVDLDFTIVKDEKIDVKKENGLVLDKEAERIFKYLSSDSYRIVLDVSGKTLSSEELANLLRDKLNTGKSDFVFIIGGPLGLSEKILKNCQFKLSLSRMTFTHQLSRLVLSEQIFRAFSIISGDKYHK